MEFCHHARWVANHGSPMPCYRTLEYWDWIVVAREKDSTSEFGQGEYVRAYVDRKSLRYTHNGVAYRSLYRALCHGRGNEVWYGDACFKHNAERPEKDEFLCGILWKKVAPREMLALAMASFARFCSLRKDAADSELLRFAIEKLANYGERGGSLRESRDRLREIAETMPAEVGKVLLTFTRLLARRTNERNSAVLADYAEFFRALEIEPSMPAFVSSKKDIILGDSKGVGAVKEAVVEMVRTLTALGQPLTIVPPAATMAPLNASAAVSASSCDV